MRRFVDGVLGGAIRRRGRRHWVGGEDGVIGVLGGRSVAAASPGPNNTMLFASGVNFGFARTLPHMAGITIGFTLMVACVGLGLGAVLEDLHHLRPVRAAPDAALPRHRGARRGLPRHRRGRARRKMKPAVNALVWSVELSNPQAVGVGKGVSVFCAISLIAQGFAPFAAAVAEKEMRFIGGK